MRGVISIILDDDEMDWAGPGTEDRNVEVTVVLVRRRGLAMYRLGTRMQAVKVSFRLNMMRYSQAHKSGNTITVRSDLSCSDTDIPLRRYPLYEFIFPNRHI